MCRDRKLAAGKCEAQTDGQGFNISYSSVCKYIQRRKAEKSKKPMDVFIKRYYHHNKPAFYKVGRGT